MPLWPVLVILAIIPLWVVWYYSRANHLLQDWARHNGLQILHKQMRFLRRGPFLFRSTTRHVVFYVAVADRGGRTRHAWVRCGGWLIGLLSDRVTVEWQD